MKSVVSIIAGASLALAVGAGGAGAVDRKHFELDSTKTLVELCSVAKSDPLSGQAVGFCLGYIEGVADFHHSMAVANGKRIACPPKGTTRREAAVVLIEWAKRNPGMLNRPALEGLLRAAAEKWPCKK